MLAFSALHCNYVESHWTESQSIADRTYTSAVFGESYFLTVNGFAHSKPLTDFRLPWTLQCNQGHTIWIITGRVELNLHKSH